MRLGNREILKQMEFEVHGGEIIAVTGQNGAGKTTLARTLCAAEVRRWNDFSERLYSFGKTEKRAVLYGHAGCGPSAFY